MGRPLIDRNGDRVGRLLVLGRAEDKVAAGGKRYVRWLCRCDCGAEVMVMSGHLNLSNTTSCGCALRDVLIDRNTSHGSTGTPEHEAWRNLKERCGNPNCREYKDYGGRGISVCERWADFSMFFADMGLKPSPIHSIDRIDVNGNYEPNNCRWATPKEQSLNRRSNVIVSYGGAKIPLSQAVELMGGSKSTYKAVHKRMKYKGMTFECAIAKMMAGGLFHKPTSGYSA